MPLRWCEHCHQHRDPRGFAKHSSACKHEQDAIASATTSLSALQNTTVTRGFQPRKRRHIENDSSRDINHSYDFDSSYVSVSNPLPGPQVVQPSLQMPPTAHIKIIHHPHSNITKPTIIPLESSLNPELEPESCSMSHETPALQPIVAESVPWAPFRNIQDFEYMEIAESRITLENHRDMEQALKAARAYVVPEGIVSATYNGQTFTFKFPYRDPWKIYENWITDPTLSWEIFWYPVQKYLCQNGKELAVYDDINTGKLWWTIQDTLPNIDGLPHCFLPTIFWLDKGMITKRVRKHPMLLRLAFLPRAIRNGSGNGGGVLIGYMPVVQDPRDPSDRSSAEKLAFACFKCEVYHKVLSVIFGSLRSRGRCGEAMECGDLIRQVIYPGIPIASVDSKESWALTSTRAGLAEYPCPKCLVSNCEQHKLVSEFKLRTVGAMKQAFEEAMRSLTKSASEKILQQNGLHATFNFFWSLPHSDPYLAISYDKLYADDLGKFGKHLWPLLLSVLEELNAKGQLTVNMHKVERWPNLKHFSNVTTVDYADGAVFFDILRCLLPCIVQLLPRDSALVKCLCAYARYRMMIQMHCMTEDRIQRLRSYIKTYMNSCVRVSAEHGKNFDFLKQHLVTHAIQDIEQKGTLDNYDTRVGEGFHQEVQEAYAQTNCKNTEPQMARIDENQEAVARIRMLIENAKLRAMSGSESESEESQPRSSESEDHWVLGSPISSLTDAKGLANELVSRGLVQNTHEFQSTL
ncbi:hypothetical protein C8R48DRAFT_780313 [Suillus tomentosus]|nr:hypothetical protein C8R48DRAFT_780313 [Suillus tomentosus]